MRTWRPVKSTPTSGTSGHVGEQVGLLARCSRRCSRRTARARARCSVGLLVGRLEDGEGLAGAAGHLAAADDDVVAVERSRGRPHAPPSSPRGRHRRAAGSRRRRPAGARRSGSGPRSTRGVDHRARRRPRRASRPPPGRGPRGRSPRRRRAAAASPAPWCGGRPGRRRRRDGRAVDVGRATTQRSRCLHVRHRDRAAGRGRQQLGGVLRRGRDSGDAGEHPRQLDHPWLVVDAAARPSRRCRPSCLATTTWVSANAATWGRWVTTSTWRSAARAARARPTARAARPPMPASTSSKTSVRHVGRAPPGCAEQHEAQGEHGAGQLAAGGDLGQRQQRRARVGGESRNVTSSPGSSSPTSTVDAGRRAWPARRRCACTASASRGAAARGPARRSPPPRATASSASQRSASSAAAASGRGRAGPAGPRASSAKAMTSASVSPYLRRRSCSSWRRSRTAASRSGSSSIASPVARRSAATSVELGGQRRAGGRPGGEGSAPGHRGHGAGDRSRSAPPSSSRRRSPRPRPRGGRGVGEEVLLGLEASSSSGSSSPAASSSATWNRSRSISRARARSSPPRAASASSSCGHVARASSNGRRSTAGERIERRPLRRRRQQRLVGVLAVEVDEPGARARPAPRPGPGGRRRRPATRPSRGTTRASTIVVVAVDEAALDDRLVGAGADEPGRPGRRPAARSPRRASSCRRRSRP